MEISGQRLSIPRNFFFLNRLPARFEILVIAKGATLAKGAAFELEILGQRLVLHSKTELKVGARYELEKISATEFKIVAEKNDAVKVAPTEAPHEPQKKSAPEDAIGFFMPESRAAYADLLAIKILVDSGRGVERKADKYLFNLESEFAVRGVFVPQAANDYSLFITGSGANSENIENLGELLAEFGIRKIRYVSEAVLERISAGAVDIQS